MNDALHDTIKRTMKTHSASYWHQGNFIAAVLTKGGKVVSVGIAKRNPNDDPDLPERGEAIALARAVKAVANGKAKNNGKKVA